MTYTKKDIYQKGKLHFEEGKIFEAFEILAEGLSPSSFLDYLSKKETDKSFWLNKQCAKDCFWNEYLLKDSNLDYFKQGIVFQKLLQLYFAKHQVKSQRFEEKLLQGYPDELIKAIRLNRLYLDSTKQEWLKSLKLPHEYFLHNIVWRKFYADEKYLWDLVESALEQIKGISIEEILAVCCIWLEEERYKLAQDCTGNLALAFQELGETYSKFIDLLQHASKLNEKFTEDALANIFANHAIGSYQFNEDKVCALLIAIRNWVNYKNVYLDTYSFEFNSNLVLENEQLFIVTPERQYLKWKQDGARYEFTKDMYFASAEEIYNAQDENILGKTNLEKETNYTIQLERLSLLLVLEDLGIVNFRINNKPYSVESIITPLLVYSGNRDLRYNKGLRDISQFRNGWKHDYLQFQLIHGSRLDCSPFILHTEKEFAELNLKAIGRFEKEHYKETLTYFTKTVSKSKFKKFDRGYNVYFNPLLRINDYLFCPIFFFSSTTWFYAIFQKTLNVFQPDRNETEYVEQNLKYLFSQNGFKCYTFSNDQVNSMDGDVDLIVEDDNISLLIQVKRSSLRTSLPEYWNEKISAELKAAQQLNDAEVFIANNPNFYPLKKKVIKWMVSSSFEGLNEVIDGCRKVNYFELITFLRQNPERNLQELISFFEEDKYLYTTLEYYKEKFGTDLTKMEYGENKVPLGDIKRFK